MYKTSISEIQEFMRCRFRWWCKYVKNFVPREEAAPLRFGTLLHEIFQEASVAKMPDAIKVTKQNWHDLAMQATDTLERDSRLKALESLEDLDEALEQWHDEWPSETLEVEEPFEFQLTNDIAIQGRPDRVIIMSQRLWHVQNRGLAPGVNFGVYLELAKRHYHEHIYAEALSQKYLPPATWENVDKLMGYGGTIFNLVRKLKFRTRNGTKKLSEMFLQHPMSIQLKDPLHLHIMECIKEYCVEMRNRLGTEDPPLPNEYMNGGMYGNSPDIYFKVLIGEIQLGDPRYFKVRENRYKELVSEGERGNE